MLFVDMLGDTMEAYVYAMLVKYKKCIDHQQDLEQVFTRMRLHNVYLNLCKCSFEVNSGKFLGFMVRQIGIEVNPEKLSTLGEMRSPTCHKEVQCLNGHMMALARATFVEVRRKSIALLLDPERQQKV